MLEFAREGDTIYVHDFSRLARSTSDLLQIVEPLQRKKIHLISNKENIDTFTPSGKLILTMIEAINEFERQNILERQREGIAIAKAHGRYKGRAPIRLDSKRFEAVYTRYHIGAISKKEMLAGDLSSLWTAFWQSLQIAQAVGPRVPRSFPAHRHLQVPGKELSFLTHDCKISFIIHTWAHKPRQ